MLDGHGKDYSLRDLAAIHGEHLAYDKQVGTLLCYSGSGAWVRFDSQAPNQYVGVPKDWLHDA